ncbi:MAG TPA: hypothetical protein PKA00_04915 [Saprospiraceae bacterium]|nr:hypothetical protein [Saprospiraceae bacterium]HMQ82223.1 hypothetical protein [Saprospiraceae bacterium]
MKSLLFFCFCLLMPLFSQAAIDQIVVSEVSESDVQSVIDAQKANSYVPIWIDAFQHRTSVSSNAALRTYFNLIFEKVSNPDDYKVQIANQLIVYPAGEYLQFLESYINGNGQLRFALIIKATGSNPVFDAVHVKSDDFQATFNNLSAQGYHLKNRSVVNVSGTNYTTGLFEKSNVGSWLSKPKLTAAQATNEMVANQGAGRTLVHMDIPTNVPEKYNLIFHQLPTNSGWYAQSNLTKAQLAVAVTNAKNNGYRTTIVCGYDVSTSVNGNETYAIRYAVTFVKPSSDPTEGGILGRKGK